MYGWKKIFTNSEIELGTDDLIDQRKASWTQGRLDNIAAVQLAHGNLIVLIEGEGKYWQSDDFEVGFFQSRPKRIKRRIQKKIEESDEIIHYNCMGTLRTIHFSKVVDKYNYSADEKIRINPEQIGCWLTVEIDLQTDAIGISIKESKI